MEGADVIGFVLCIGWLAALAYSIWRIERRERYKALRDAGIKVGLRLDAYHLHALHPLDRQAR